MHWIRREPVMVVKGLISAVVVLLTGFGVNLPENFETGVQAAVPLLAGGLAAFMVRRPDSPTVVVGAIFSALFVALAAVGWDLPEDLETAVQTIALATTTFLTRERVESLVPGSATGTAVPATVSSVRPL
jgi:ABC-type thiamin/hydroxymethylpyrimidine transport system permease subunit